MSTHGGKRTGAGRKPNPNAKVPISARVSKEVALYLANQGASKTIDETVKRSKQYREWLKCKRDEEE